ncbi:MAG TPA: UTP--glucose-1-phosphate uridylyltransferase [Clostridiales bacterium]|jgi:UTP--glucose-1-phosphate uridylyltransferase|nr:UTP--glucose-1-phosphate uridylyltransferase [Clostridiales bacterium]
MKVKKAVIPAAGLGTRFLPSTKAQPKEMLNIFDKPSIQYIVEEAVEAGIEDILIILGRNKKSIEDHFDKSYELEDKLKSKGKKELLEGVEKISNLGNIHYIRQKEPLGLGHAIYCAKAFVGNEPFAVMLGDDIVKSKKPCIKQLIEKYEEYNSTIIGVQEVEKSQVDKYGIVKGEKINERLYKVEDLVEKPKVKEAPSNIAILGRYVISPEIFPILQHTKPGAGNEIQLTDGLKELARRRNVYSYVFEGKRYDVGNKLGFLEATVEFALDDKELGSTFKKYLKNLIK